MNPQGFPAFGERCTICGASVDYSPCPNCANDQYCPACDNCRICGPDPRRKVRERAGKHRRIKQKPG